MRLLLVLLLLGPGAVSRAVEANVPAPKPPWGRVVMVGASATAGFTASATLLSTNPQHLRLSRYIDAALLAPHEPVRNLANLLFFMDPESAGRHQVEDALAAEPTLVIGVDFLFWFCYGDGRTDRERLQRFEHGLGLLDAIRCPLLLGDLPDASSAVDTMLMKHQIPSAPARAAANRRLREWAAARPHVVLVPLAEYMRAVMGDQPVALRGRTLPAGRTRALLQDDRLHPSPAGAATLAVAILDAFHTARPHLGTNDVRWDPADVFRLGSQPAPASPAKAER